jgi:hypothetical protein
MSSVEGYDSTHALRVGLVLCDRATKHAACQHRTGTPRLVAKHSNTAAVTISALHDQRTIGPADGHNGIFFFSFARGQVRRSGGRTLPWS